jgi:hypothetical protein
VQLNTRITTQTVALRSATLKEIQMTDDMKKEPGQNPEHSGQQYGQQHPKQEDASKKNPTQDRSQEQDDKQKQTEQGGRRKAS